MDSLLLEGPKRDLLGLIKRRGQISLSEAVESLPLAKATLRQHLLKMEELGLIARRYDSSKGPGRPEVIFEITAQGERFFPSKSADLLVELVDYLKAGGQQETIEGFLKVYWERRKRDFEKYLREGRRQKPRASEGLLRREALRGLLEDEGFMPEIKYKKSTGVSVKECHCPFADLLPASTAPCRLESDFISWALKAPIERKSYIPKGDKSCTYVES